MTKAKYDILSYTPDGFICYDNNNANGKDTLNYHKTPPKIKKDKAIFWNYKDYDNFEWILVQYTDSGITISGILNSTMEKWIVPFDYYYNIQRNCDEKVFYIQGGREQVVRHAVFDQQGNNIIPFSRKYTYILKSATIIQYTIKGRFMSR